MSKYKIQYTNKFKKSYKKVVGKQGHDQNDFRLVV